MILPFWQRTALAGCPRFVPTSIPGCVLWAEGDTTAHPTAVVFPVDVVVNGAFAADATWTKGANWTIPTPYALHAAGSTATLSQAAILVIGNTYATRIIVTSATAGTVTVSAGTTAGTARFNGDFTETLLCAGNTTLAITPSNDFDGRITLVQALPRNVSQLTDLSGAGHHLVQTTATSQPLWVPSGRGGLLRFDGSDDYMASSFSLAQPCSRFLLMKWSQTASAQYIIDGSGGSDKGGIYRPAGTDGIRLYAPLPGGPVTLPSDDWIVLDDCMNGAASYVGLNGAAPVTGNSGLSDPNGVYLASSSGSYCSRADIAATIIYDRVLAEPERQRVIRYLRRKAALLGVTVP